MPKVNKNSEPIEHKDPKDRAHVWERPARADEQPEVESRDLDEDGYPEIPRHLHKANGEWLRVDTREEYDAGRANGWLLLPPKVEVPKVDAPKAPEKQAGPRWPF